MPRNPRLSQDAQGKWKRQKMPEAPKWTVTYPGQSKPMAVRAAKRRDATEEAAQRIFRREGIDVFPLDVTVQRTDKSKSWTFNVRAVVQMVDFRLVKQF